MKNKQTSLYELTKLLSNPDLSEPYIRYVAGLGTDYKYKDYEIRSVEKLENALSNCDQSTAGFFYSYSIPQLGKEFDLLKVTPTEVINVELKSQNVDKNKIAGQLKANKHYLKMIGRKVVLVTFVSSTGDFWRLNDDNELEATDSSYVSTALDAEADESIDLDSFFAPSKILVSPLNSPKEFLDSQYLLTERQNEIKNNILNYIEQKDAERFVGIIGGPGTGKTLLLYDLAKTIGIDKKVLIIHSGMLCEGHERLNSRLANVKIVPAKDLKYKEIKNIDIVLVDETQRLYPNHFEKVRKWVEKAKAICIFSFDKRQCLSKFEERNDIVKDIKTLCENHIYTLPDKIRTNKEIAQFIKCLCNLNRYVPPFHFPNVKIIYEESSVKAVKLAKSLRKDGYVYISYTESRYSSYLSFQASELNTHKVIGQEFDKVCMIMGDDFYYEDNTLKSRTHPNPDYIFTKLLYQGLTRARSKIALIITSPDLLEKIMPMFVEDKKALADHKKTKNNSITQSK